MVEFFRSKPVLEHEQSQHVSNCEINVEYLLIDRIESAQYIIPTISTFNLPTLHVNVGFGTDNLSTMSISEQ
jgi:hypothetical protein